MEQGIGGNSRTGRKLGERQEPVSELRVMELSTMLAIVKTHAPRQTMDMVRTPAALSERRRSKPMRDPQQRDMTTLQREAKHERDAEKYGVGKVIQWVGCRGSGVQSWRVIAGAGCSRVLGIETCY